VVDATARLISGFRHRGLPVMFTAVGFQEGEPSNWLRKMPGLAVLRERGAWCEIDPRLGRLKREPFWVKRAPSAFFGTPLSAHLTSSGIDTVVVTGCVTSGCIRATTIDAASAGLRVIVPSECVGDRSQDVHIANIFDIDSQYGDVGMLDDVFQHFEGDD
jgi:maleamate amidohydrolase